jgi:hypothetical protein
LRRDLSNIEDDTAIDLDAFISQAWWQRAWTYQEFVLSSQMVFLCGDRVLSSSQLFGGIEQLFAPDAPTRPPGPDVEKAFANTQFSQFSLLFINMETTESIVRLRHLITTWMSVKRPTTWNGKVIRRSLDGELQGETTGIAYQEQGLAVLQSVLFRLLFWGSGLALSCFVALATIFSLVFILGIIPAAILRTIGILAIFASVLGLAMAIIVLMMKVIIATDDAGALYFGPDVRFGFTVPLDGRDSDTIYLGGLIQAIRERNATDLKDKVFAAHGVLSRLGVQLTPPDYKKPKEIIYQELLTDMITWQPQMIRLIADAGITKRLDGVPSWVPDWSELRDQNYFDADVLYYSSKSNSTTGWVPEVSVNGNTLKVLGAWKGDVVDSCGTFQQTGVQEDEFAAQVYRLASWMQYTRQNASIDYGNIPRSVNWVLLGANALMPDAKERKAFDAAYRALVSWTATGDASTAPAETWRKRVEEGIVDAETVETIKTLIDRLVSEQRTVFTTSEGYMGTGPSATSIGDRVALIGGVGFPMILRESNQTAGEFEVVGPSLVVGYMQLEEDAEPEPMETITII